MVRKIKRFAHPVSDCLKHPDVPFEFWEGQTLGQTIRNFRDQGVPPSVVNPRTFDEDDSEGVDPHADIRTDFSLYGEGASERSADIVAEAKRAKRLQQTAEGRGAGSESEQGEA